MRLRACETEVAQQVIVELSQVLRAQAPTRPAPHRIDHRRAKAAGGIDQESKKRPVV
jgi:hypothetical protein